MNLTIPNYYGTLKEFVQIRDRCIFCHQLLTPILTNGTVCPVPNIVDIHAPLQCDQFQFRFKYDGERFHFDIMACIDAQTNRFSYYYNAESSSAHDDTIASVLNGLSPHIELACENQVCGMDYCLQSDTVYIGTSNYIRPICLAMECFVTNKLWVANYYNVLKGPIYDATWIFSRFGSQIGPLTCPRLSFETIPKSTLITKIQTVANFS